MASLSTTSTRTRIHLANVWADDPIACKAILRNRSLHENAAVASLQVPVTTRMNSEVTTTVNKPIVYLGLDDSRGIMAAHQPLASTDWPKNYSSPTALPGHLTTFNATISANERPERITVATDYLLQSEIIVENCDLTTLSNRGRPATESELLRVHDQKHVEKMLSCLPSSNMTLCQPCHLLDVATSFNTIFMNEHSVDAALFAAGLTIEATRAVLGTAPLPPQSPASAVCVVRPPGHHSECGCAMGFGIFNSVAIATADTLENPDNGINRILIVDWDIHHGNGTQEIFANDKRVLYMSAHALYSFPAFIQRESSSSDTEGTKGSGGEQQQQLALQSPSYVGGKDAQGFSVNCAWEQSGYGDCEYMCMMDHLIMPIATEFAPQLVFVSAGFDSAAGDEEGYRVTPTGYARMIRKLKTLADGKIVVVLVSVLYLIKYLFISSILQYIFCSWTLFLFFTNTQGGWLQHSCGDNGIACCSGRVAGCCCSGW